MLFPSLQDDKEAKYTISSSSYTYYHFKKAHGKPTPKRLTSDHEGLGVLLVYLILFVYFHILSQDLLFSFLSVFLLLWESFPWSFNQYSLPLVAFRLNAHKFSNQMDRYRMPCFTVTGTLCLVYQLSTIFRN